MGATYSVSGLSTLTSSSSGTWQTLQTLTYSVSTRTHRKTVLFEKRKKKCLTEGIVNGSKPGSQELQQIPGLPCHQDHPVEDEVDSEAL